MSCISSNFSSFFLNSLNDPSEFAKYLSNGELRFSSEDFQSFGGGQAQYSTPQQQQLQHQNTNGNSHDPYISATPMETNYSAGPNANYAQQATHTNNHHLPAQSAAVYPQQRWHNTVPHPHNTTHTQHPAHTHHHAAVTPSVASSAVASSSPASHGNQVTSNGHFDGSFEFLKYLRHSTDNASDSAAPNHNTANNTNNHHHTAAAPPAGSSLASSLIDLDSSTTQKSRSSRKVAALLSSVSRASNSLDASSSIDVFDHDSKHTIFDIQQHSNSNESSMEISNLAFPHSHMNASNSNTSSEGATGGHTDFSILNSSAAANAPKPLTIFTLKENFDVHPSHKVEEGIFQHMNKLPPKKKETLKQLGVRFTGQMTLSDKTIVVDNFIKFCQEYDIKDHRPFLSLNQSGLPKSEQIKFARYLGVGLPTFTLFCIYSNFKNLFCTKRTETYTKDGYNLPYILDKTKRFLANTTAGGSTPNKQNLNHNNAAASPAVAKTQPHVTVNSQPLPPQPPATVPVPMSVVPMSMPMQVMTMDPTSM